MTTAECQPSCSAVVEKQETPSEFIQRCQQVFGIYSYYKKDGVIAIYSPETDYLPDIEVISFFYQREYTCSEVPKGLPSNAPGSYSFIVPDKLYNVKMGPMPKKRKAKNLRTDWIGNWTDMQESKVEMIKDARIYTSEKYSNPNGMKRQFGFITDLTLDTPRRLQNTVFYQYIIPGDVTTDESAIPSPASPSPPRIEEDEELVTPHFDDDSDSDDEADDFETPVTRNCEDSDEEEEDEENDVVEAVALNNAVNESSADSFDDSSSSDDSSDSDSDSDEEPQPKRMRSV